MGVLNYIIWRLKSNYQITVLWEKWTTNVNWTLFHKEALSQQRLIARKDANELHPVKNKNKISCFTLWRLVSKMISIILAFWHSRCQVICSESVLLVWPTVCDFQDQDIKVFSASVFLSSITCSGGSQQLPVVKQSSSPEEKPIWGRTEASPVNTNNLPAMWDLRSRFSTFVKPSGDYSLRRLGCSLMKRPWARIPQLSHSEIPDLQRLWEIINVYYCFKSQSFWLVIYVVTNITFFFGCYLFITY